MAALALPTELARVHVILLMTRHTVRRNLHLACGLDVAIGTLEFTVRARKPEACLLKMIENP